MGKKSRERRELSISNRFKPHVNFYDLLLLADDGSFSTDISNAVVLKNDEVLKHISASTGKEIIAQIYKHSIHPPFERVFIEHEVRADEILTGFRGAIIQTLEDGFEMVMIGYKFKKRILIPLAGWRVWVDDNWLYKSDKMVHYEFYSEDLKDSLTARFVSILFTLVLLNCRNIELVDHEPDPETSRKYQQHFGQPLTKYKTLAVKPMGKRYESGSDPKEYQGLMPLHLRRGNFATYTEAAPLFGKYTGTFWRPATAVGEAKNGVVVKDYKIVPGDE